MRYIAIFDCKEKRIKTMKNKWTTLALILGIGLLISGLISQNQNLKEKLELQKPDTDTIWMNKPFSFKVEYPNFNIPSKLFIYRVDSIPIDRVEYIGDTITIIRKDSVKVEYKGQFLTNYPNNPKLIQLLIDKNKLSISSFNTDCTLTTEEYDINLIKYRYNYTPGKLTFKKTKFISKFSPVTQYTIRPFHNMHDIDLGVKYNTSKFNYEAGLNLNYYPSLKPGIGTDLYLRVQYNF